MSIIAICGVGIVSAISALLLRRQSPQSAFLLSVGSGIIILLSVISGGISGMNAVSALLTQSGISNKSVMILLKVMGICFVTEFSCDCVTEAGMASLSTNIALAGKILVLTAALPLLQPLLELIAELTGV